MDSHNPGSPKNNKTNQSSTLSAGEAKIRAEMEATKQSMRLFSNSVVQSTMLTFDKFNQQLAELKKQVAEREEKEQQAKQGSTGQNKNSLS
jgi:hypothetical protein